jgi:hypothetical protein
MKRIAHLFEQDIISSLLGSGFLLKNSFEFMAALIMSKIYQQQWRAKTYIGFYLKPEVSRTLEKAGTATTETYVEVLQSGIQENHEIDFIISTSGEPTDSGQQFQLKRYGLGAQEVNTQALAQYINQVKDKYSKTDATLLIALTDLSGVEYDKLKSLIQTESFPFTELLLIGMVDDSRFFVIGLLPEGGFSEYQIEDILSQ